jgi:hypothetical protein
MVFTQEYLKIIDEVICNNPKDNVILLEIEPKSKTQKLILTKDIGIPIICVTELIKKKTGSYFKKMKIMKRYL